MQKQLSKVEISKKYAYLCKCRNELTEAEKHMRNAAEALDEISLQRLHARLLDLIDVVENAEEMYFNMS